MGRLKSSKGVKHSSLDYFGQEVVKEKTIIGPPETNENHFQFKYPKNMFYGGLDSRNVG